MLAEGEALQVSFLPYRCMKFPPVVTRQMSNLASWQMSNLANLADVKSGDFGRCQIWQIWQMSNLAILADVKFGNFGRCKIWQFWRMSNLAILADFKTQNASLFPLHAMFCHDCPLTVRLASMQWNLANKKKKTWRDSAPIDMFLSAVSVLVVPRVSSEVPEGLMNYPVFPLCNLRKKGNDLEFEAAANKLCKIKPFILSN